jgi:type I restriction enzyme M protein
MDNQIYNQIVSFIWGIADDCLFNVYVRGKYRDVILPMTVIRRLDAVLEDTKDDVLKMKATLDKAGIVTYIWILSNRKEERRKGKIQLIDATELKSPLRKNLGKKNCELTTESRKQIMDLFLNFKETENGNPVLDKKGQADKETDTEQIPLNYEGGIKAFFKKEVLPYAPDAWIDEKKTQIGYEISFTKHFYKPVQLRTLSDIVADIRTLEQETDGLLESILKM